MKKTLVNHLHANEITKANRNTIGEEYGNPNQSILNNIRLIDVVAALVEVAEASNSRTLPSFHYPHQYAILKRSSQPIAALLEVAEASNVPTLPSFHCPCQHDIVERSSQPSIRFALVMLIQMEEGMGQCMGWASTCGSSHEQFIG
ncbi:hypothetical protein Tco_0859536 [Tanacetum coccineum]|uniref:Uncharacterized protein n=1 Tax=Tanacetum coccineum TaxID=301880 RepID=A0ABQ5BG69_9ASTR